MKHRYLYVLAAPLAVALASCGGSHNPSVPVVTGPTPTPSPSPSPTPTPTPSAPSASYDKSSDFDRDRSFNAIGLRVVTSTPPSGLEAALDSRIDAESVSVGFDFAATTQTYRARYIGENLLAATQRKSYSPSNYTYDVYSQGQTSFTRSPSFIGASYVGYVLWTDSIAAVSNNPSSQINRLMIFGSRTLVNDLPTAGVRSFTGLSSTFGGVASEGRAATINVNYSSHMVTVTSAYQPPAAGSAGSGSNQITEPFTMSGTFDPATGRISGTVSYQSTTGSGKFEGALYGPQSAEAGILFSGARPDGRPFYGFIIAKG
ncbi:hypothetical protein [Sphingomonas sp. GC_Shp_3]|uniref:hypothetical protein n=1 Tax=Sphingomonas sp. GC_Shp_3 TaxID=2937383 RepID=UPI00226A44DA|nr:hypothetical protein [Sphingomonas sp. GC_Shp_3]